MSLIKLKHDQIDVSLAHFRRAARRRSECVVLFLGRRVGATIEVVDVVRPQQEAGLDFFHIPPQAMRRLFNKLRKNRLMVAAQAHTHPARAFHSEADDHWAIIRHHGALSIVLPYFAKATTCDSFVSDIALFKYSEANQWEEVPPKQIPLHLEVIR
jgi:biotin carboxylase